jgi:alanyl-tRNA synthetase
VSATERFRGGLRVTFLCGGRALTGFRALRDTVTDGVRALSVLPAELPAAIERMQAENRELRHQLKGARITLGCLEADDLVHRAVDVGGTMLVTAWLMNKDAETLRMMAARIVQRPGYLAVLVGDTAAAASAIVVVARAADVRVDAGAVLRHLVQRHGGKGGGRPELAQGGGLTSPAMDVLESAREFITAHG